jgi:serine/threonine protein kinase
MSDSHPPAAFLAPEPADLAPLFPGYEIESLIATGGMGAVYCAVQKSLDRTVAIKILPQEFSNDVAFCAGFEAEAKAMARLNHPNLIGVYDFGNVHGMLYIIMEYIPGKSLFHSAHGIAIDPGVVIHLITGICHGLAHAHENGILHRDIKPSNILLDLNAQPKIGDFGLARPIETKIQEGDEIFGTPHYTAPEVVNSPHSVNYRADIFSVGVILHELLTGLLPAQDRRPASAIAHCDRRFDAIIRRATNPLPELRYASAAEVANDLHTIANSAGPRILRSAAPAISPRPIPPRMGMVATRPPTESSGIPGIVIGVLVVIVAAVTLIYFSSRSNHRNLAPPNPPAAISKTPEETTLTPVIHPTPEPEPEPTPPPEPEPKPIPPPVPPPIPKPIHIPKPEPEPVLPAQPKFDVAGFLVRARQIMQDRATPLIATRDENLKKNLAGFERGVKRLIRKIESNRDQTRGERRLDDLIKECETAGCWIPKHLPEKLAGDLDLRGLHREYRQKQKAIDDTLMQELSGLGPIYALGLDKQIERLNSGNDAAEITLIRKEMKLVREDVEYFPNLMLGIQPASKEPVKEPVKKPVGNPPPP